MMRKYESQSLAIVLAILLIGSIVGFALYARLARESSRVVDERAASESHEVVETVVGLINSAGYEKVGSSEVLDLLGCSTVDNGCRVNDMNLDELKDVFEKMGFEGLDFSGFEADLGSDYCLSELSLSSLSADGITIEQDDVHSVFLNAVDWTGCTSVNFTMDSLSGATGFVMSTFYRDVGGAYKPYEFDDILGFKYGDVATGDNWVKYNSDLLKFSSGLKVFDGSNYSLDEVRFKSLGGSSVLKWTTSGTCAVKDHLLVEVGATCGGKYVGKSFILPEEYFAPPIFDYVYFQGQGDLD